MLGTASIFLEVTAYEPPLPARDTHEIKIDDFEISWNLDGGEAFAISPTSIHEAGCIHTTQGLEFEYVGVIIGDDMRYGNGHIVTDYTKRARTDQSIKGLKKMEAQDPERAHRLADEIIKNTYRTLMTRGMKGCYVYATNPDLREYLRNRSQPASDYHVMSIRQNQYPQHHQTPAKR